MSLYPGQDLYPGYSESQIVRLPTGREIRLSNVDLDPATQRFTYGPLDVTPYLTPLQKRQFNAFDVERANREASDAARDAAGLPRVPEGETSALTLFAEGVGNDLSKLATDTRDLIGIGPENAGKGSPLLRWLLVAGVGLLLWKVGVFDWVKKKLTA